MADETGQYTSAATKILLEVKDVLVEIEGVVKYTQTPMSELADYILDMENYGRVALDALKSTNKVFTSLDRLLFLCEYLAKLIPDVGPILSYVAKAIKKSKIFTMGKVTIEKLNKIIKKVFSSILLWLSKADYIHRRLTRL